MNIVEFCEEQNFENFDFERIFFIEAVEGKFVISALTAALVSIGITASVTIAGTTIALAAVLANIIVMVVVSVIMGAIMEALAPTQTSESHASANLTFSSMDNIGTQGSAIPLIFGEALVTGVVIGRRTETHTKMITDTFTAPSLPDSIPTITRAGLPSAPVGVWRKLKN